MFVDTAKVFIQAGKGGNGAVSFRREIYIDKGGPDGGDGGKGGDVIFRADSSMNTLINFRYKPELKAQNGANGSKRNKRGRSGEDLVVKVPVGTLVKKDGEILFDLTCDGEEIVVARGGDGGFGNAHFKSSVRQTPKIAELGEEGETFESELELKLLADVGLLGFPNAGKSTFLSVVTNAKPEIANYEFTTLTPNLGVADIDDGSILIADIPGIIEGASEGKGLGDAFLKHVERTAVLLHLIDIYSEDIAKSYETIRGELKKYSTELSTRPEVIALTKTEGLDQDIIDMQIEELKKVADDALDIFAISSIAHSGTKEVLRALRKKVQEVRAIEAESIEDEDEEEFVTISLPGKDIEEAWFVDILPEEDGVKVFEVSGQKIEKFAKRTNFDGFENVNRLRDIMKKMGISHELTRKGATGESIVVIGDSRFTFMEQ